MAKRMGEPEQATWRGSQIASTQYGFYRAQRAFRSVAHAGAQREADEVGEVGQDPWDDGWDQGRG
jgi:hypothetical protein